MNISWRDLLALGLLAAGLVLWAVLLAGCREPGMEDWPPYGWPTNAIEEGR